MGRKPKEHTYNVQQDLLNFKEKLKAQAKDIVGENALEITQNVTSQGLTLPSDIFTFQPVSPKQFIESSEYFGNNRKN
jgi:5-bromo-4-chloroindolyl phosphate hydrolysis protein